MRFTVSTSKVLFTVIPTLTFLYTKSSELPSSFSDEEKELDLEEEFCLLHEFSRQKVEGFMLGHMRSGQLISTGNFL